ncbi:MAG: ArnT family glycosyltransferase [Planctomycetota bacterium]|jgi:hypothetical protein
MSKSRSRSRSVRRRALKSKPVSAGEQLSRKKIAGFAVIVLIAVLAGIPFTLGKYFEFNSPDPYDSGLNVYSAQHILNGAEIGVQEKPSAALATLLVNMLGVWLFGFNETGPKFMQMLFQAAALVLMFVAMRKLLGTLAAAVGVIIASVYLSAPLIAKFGNVKDQFAIACNVIAVSCLVLYQFGGKKWLAIVAGVFLSWAPLFKPTGTSALGAVGLFIILQPVLKHRTWKQTGVDILLLAAGAAIALVPLYVWIIGWDVQLNLPSSFAWQTIGNMLPGAGEQAKGGVAYVKHAKKLVPFSQQWPRVLRYYRALIMPIALAASSIILCLWRVVFRRRDRSGAKDTPCDRFVLLLAAWWILDMAFVWVSPRSYEQYYLPLNASAAMLGGYAIALYWNAASKAVYKIKWVAVGLAALVLMVVMSWHIFVGVYTSPHSGTVNKNRRTGEPERYRGYRQKLDDIRYLRKSKATYPWQDLGDYIRLNSSPTDKMYVWGWFPGMYIRAQRFSAASKACMMPRPMPARMTERVEELLAEFERERPKFIVDSRKRHVPMERPPYELWPFVQKGFMGMQRGTFLPRNDDIVARYDAEWSATLRRRFDEDEALRYEILKPLREFVMQNYKRANVFGQHVLFQLKGSTTSREPQ